MGTKRTATLIRVFGILSLGVLIGGAAGVGAMFLPSAKAAPVVAVAPAQAAPVVAPVVVVTLPVAALPPAPEPAVVTVPEVVAPVVATAVPAPKADVSRRVLSSVAFAKKKARAAAKPAADAPKAADRADDEPLPSAGKATAEAKALEKAQLEALLR